MTQLSSSQQNWLQQYSVEDLSRTIIREYLYQHSMFKTLNCFQSQDKENQKKINRSILIKMLSLTNLVIQNKQSSKQQQCKSLLTMLVKYLRGKFEKKVIRQNKSDRDDHYSQKSIENKQFSMNGDYNKTKGTQINQIKSNNFMINSDYDKQISTQDGFYKKKSIKIIQNSKKQQQSSIQTNQLNSRTQKQVQKYGLKNRPGTANPSKQLKSNQKQSENIYQKLKTNIVNQQNKKQIQNQINKNKNGNNAIIMSTKSTKLQQKNEKNIQKELKKQHQLVVNEKKQEQQIQKQVSIGNIHIQEKKQDIYQVDFEQEKQFKNDYISEKKQIEEVEIKKQQIKVEQNHKNVELKEQKCQIQIKQVKMLEEQKVEEINKKNINDSSIKQEDTIKPTIASGARVMRKILKKSEKQQSTSYQIKNKSKQKNQPSPLNNNIETINKDEETIQNQLIENKPKVLKQQLIKQQKLQSNVALTTSTKNMMILKKKPKNNQPEEATQYPSKFKFDENFIDEPLNKKIQHYSYEVFKLQKMVIKPELKPKNSENFVLETKIDYTQKAMIGSGKITSSKKVIQRPLNAQKASQLKTIMFQKGNSNLPKAWHQGFILSPFKDTPYGLKQLQGGPCGIIAAVQCYFLKHLLYLSKPKNEEDIKNQIRRETCLVAALCDILWKVKSGDKITLIIPTNKNFSGSKIDFANLLEVQIQAKSFQQVYEAICAYKSSFLGHSNHGVTVLIYSIVMTKGIKQVYDEIDIKENPLIGHHGHCTQELVNLFISGQASSNCFDGKKQLDQGFVLHGISNKGQFGFLTVYQTLEYIEVGKNLKNPLFPIWIISKQFHYHVTFGNHYLISENNDCEKFDLIYFDGLYACENFIRLTFDKIEKDQFGMVKENGKIKDLPLIEQVLLKKWGRRKVDWNGSIKIL